MSRLDDLGEPPTPFVIGIGDNVGKTLNQARNVLNAQMQYADQLIKAIRADHEDARKRDE